jgi:hypothetical protein
MKYAPKNMTSRYIHIAIACIGVIAATALMAPYAHADYSRNYNYVDHSGNHFIPNRNDNGYPNDYGRNDYDQNSYRRYDNDGRGYMSYQHQYYQYHNTVVVQQPVYYQTPQYYYDNAPSYSYASYPYAYEQTSYPYYSSAQYQYASSAQYPTTGTPQSGGVSVTCSADPSSVTTNQPVTWTAQVAGGVAPYTYSWSGSNGLTGSQRSVTQYYISPGQENAIVSVTSSDGSSAVHACSLSVAPIYANTGYGSTANSAQQQSNQSNSPVNPNAAAAVLATGSISWGSIAFIIIVIMLIAVAYLLVERRKA